MFRTKHPDDLFMAPRKRTVYVNLYALGVACWHDDEAAARRGAKNAGAIVIALPVEIED